MQNAPPANIRTQLNKKTIISSLTYLNVIGIIIFFIGLLMLYYVFEYSFYFILGFSDFDPSWIIRLAYLILITCIGGFLIRQAILLLGDSRVLSVIILVIGLISLIFIFWTAQLFIEMPYQLNEFTLVGLLFFGIMIAIGMFFFGKGMSDMIKIRNRGFATRTEPPSENIIPPETVIMENSAPPENRKEDFKICPQCLSKLSLDDTHCINCGKKQE